MELFVVKNRSGNVVGKGFSSKSVAKAERDRLQTEQGGGLPALTDRHNQNLWGFKVSPGKDHHQNTHKA